MKALFIKFAFFKLPANFSGSLPEALRLLADRIEKTVRDGTIRTEPHRICTFDEAYDAWWREIHETDRLATLNCAIAEERNGKFISIDSLP